jgi:hypothetical protein
MSQLDGGTVSPHISDDLPRLLTGEASRDEIMAAAAHLRTCVDCQQELTSAVVAHASLSSARRFAPEVVSGVPDELLAAPPGERELPDVETATDTLPAKRTPPELPDLSAVFAQVRREAAEPRRKRHRVRRRYLVAAAAAVVLVGGGTAAYVVTSGGSQHAPSGTRTVHLAAFDKGTTSGTATIAAGARIRIDAASLPEVSGKRYEVWLTNSARTQLLPVGWIGADGTTAVTVPNDLLDRFTDIEVSVQPVDAKNYEFSGTSVLRGGYA